MVYLILCILSSTLIFVIFRIAKNYQSDLSTLITFNYLTATLLGIVLFKPFNQLLSASTFPNWIIYCFILGILFITVFFLIGSSSQKAGITVTTMATKLSLVFPVMFSLVYFNEHVTTIKYVGLATALAAIALTVYKKDLNKTNLAYVLLPLSIFLGSGIIDSLVKFVQGVKINEAEVPLYTTLVFFIAFMCGGIILFFQKKSNTSFNKATLILGILLGTVNFGSLYFLINALNKSLMNSSLVFALNNMSIVALTALTGTILFKEKLNKINFAGIILSIISLYFLL